MEKFERAEGQKRQTNGRTGQVGNFRGAVISKNGILLIAFAWAMEIVGVSAGIINSTYTTFGEDLPRTFTGYIPAVPMVALAVAELGRVPLSSAIFHKHKLTQGPT